MSTRSRSSPCPSSAGSLFLLVSVSSRLVLATGRAHPSPSDVRTMTRNSPSASRRSPVVLQLLASPTSVFLLIPSGQTSREPRARRADLSGRRPLPSRSPPVFLRHRPPRYRPPAPVAGTDADLLDPAAPADGRPLRLLQESRRSLGLRRLHPRDRSRPGRPLCSARLRGLRDPQAIGLPERLASPDARLAAATAHCLRRGHPR